MLFDLKITLIPQRVRHSLPIFSRSAEAEVDAVAGGRQPRHRVEAHCSRGGRDGGVTGGPAPVTRSGTKEGQEDGQEDEAVEGPQEDHEEDHLEEGYEEVAGGEGEADDPEDGADGPLDNRKTQCEQAGGNLGVRALVLDAHVVIADVGGVVNREADAHDQVDQGHAVQVDAPPGKKGLNSRKIYIYREISYQVM